MNSDGKFFHKSKFPVIVAGPCSAESENQVLDTAFELVKQSQVKIFRAGVWKPRTKPGQFEGVGDIGLQWLQKVQKETGLFVATEVATSEHAKKALDSGIDVLWIGARTSGNPIYVQEIANAVKGSNVKIMVKNPLHPDVDLWHGAIQRFYDVGIKDIAAVHRGFYPYEKTVYRNLPLWEIPIELRLKQKDLPVYCDPSHISGNTDFIESISQQAMDLNMCGLMIEVHNNPCNALTDKSQQLSPLELKHLLENLEVRKEKFRDKTYKAQMEKLRKEIDQIDFLLLDLLAQRQSVIKDIAKSKAEMNVSILQLNRWENVLKTRLKYAKNHDLDKSYILKLLQVIHKEAIRIQTEVMKSR